MPMLLSAQRLAFFAAFGVLTASVFACSTKESDPSSSSGDDDDDETVADKKDETSSSSSSFCCGVNQQYWDCPSSKALDACSDLGDPDPSACKKRTKPCSDTSSTGDDDDDTTDTATATKKKEGAVCKPTDECEDGTLCTVYEQGQNGVCFKQCESWSDCSGFDKCCKLNNVPTQVCVPENLAEGASSCDG